MKQAAFWRPWAPEVFQEAKAADKPIFVNVAARWCHWCHVMDAQTFSDPKVAALLAERFVAIRVDADERPDVAERYQDWGWPANIVLTPDAGRVAERKGFVEPHEMAELLGEVARLQSKGKLKANPPAKPAKPHKGTLEEARDALRARLDAFFDGQEAGWGRFQKYPFAGPVEDGLLRGKGGDGAARDRALRTVEATLNLTDPVWGGVFQYSTDNDWIHPHYEKIASVQAAALESFTLAWMMTGEKRLLQAALDVQNFVLHWLRRDDGSFATSLDADVGATVGQAYYTKSDADRRAIGYPKRDDAAYADWNGLLIHALVQHAESTRHPKSLVAAKEAAMAIMETHWEDSWFRHGEGPDRIAHLRDNVAMGRALVALAEATEDDAWLRCAEAVARFVMDCLQAPEGGFWAHSEDPSAVGEFRERRRPFEDNGLAIRFLLEVAGRTRDCTLADACRAAAERAARVLAVPAIWEPEAQIVGQFLLGLEWLCRAFPTIVVAGEAGTTETRDLWSAAQRLARPRTVRRSIGDEYPPGTAAYICVGESCQRVTDPKLLAA